MLTYNLDIEQGSLWLRATPGELALAQPFYCTEAGIFYAREHFSTVRDYKDSYLLFFTLEGKGVISQGDSTVCLEPGQALFLDCRTPQSYYTDPETGKWTHYWIHIDGPGIRGMRSVLFPEGKFSVFRTGGDGIRGEFDLLLRSLENTSVSTILTISLSIHKTLTSLITARTVAVSRNQMLIGRAASYLNAHYGETVDLHTLLSMTHMSKSYFMRLFRQYIGTTPYNYQLSLRITKAKEYLELTDMTIHEIAMKTGFSDDPSFSTRFSSMVGISPLKYRQSSITRIQKQHSG